MSLSIQAAILLPQTEWIKQHTCISHRARGWHVQDQGVSRSGVWGEPLLRG